MVHQQGADKTSRSMTHSTSDEWLWGLELIVEPSCRCGCARQRVHPHSIKSNIPIWRCVWCCKRKGKLTEDEIELLEDWLHRFGWTMEPLVFHEDGIIYAHCQLPALREATSGLRRQAGLVPTMSANDTALDGDGLSGKGECAVARSGSDAAFETGVEPD